MPRLHSLPLGVLLLASAPVSAPSAPIATAPLPAPRVPAAPQRSAAALDPVELAAALDSARVELVDLALPPAGREGSLRLTLPLDGAPRELLLARRTQRAADFRVWSTDAQGHPVAVPAPPPSTYRGRVTGAPASVVAASWTGAGLRAWIELDDELFVVQPVAAIAPGAPPTLHAVHRRTDAVPVGGQCGVPDPGLPIEWLGTGEAVPGDPSGDDTGEDLGGDGDALEPGPDGSFFDFSLTEIAFDADVEYWQVNGSSVAATVADIEALLNAAEAIYYAEHGICYAVTTIVVRTSEPDPYGTTSPTGLLDTFEAEWNANMQSVQRDIAHLCTGKNLDANWIGWARGSAICQSVVDGTGYSLSSPNFTSNDALRAGLLAHELGHNWGAGHCSSPCGDKPFTFDPDCAVMCACIGGCTGDVTNFGSAATAQIVGFQATLSCLSPCSSFVWVDVSHGGPELGTQVFPFDTFEEGLAAAAPGGVVFLAGGLYPETLGVNQVVLVDAHTGAATVGD